MEETLENYTVNWKFHGNGKIDEIDKGNTPWRKFVNASNEVESFFRAKNWHIYKWWRNYI